MLLIAGAGRTMTNAMVSPTTRPYSAIASDQKVSAAESANLSTDSFLFGSAHHQPSRSWAIASTDQ